MTTQQLFPSGPAYSHLAFKATIKMFAVDDAANPPTPGWLTPADFTAEGPAGAPGAPGQGFTFRGAWAANTAYATYDVVTYGGSTYGAAVPIAASGAFGAGSWVLMAQGAAGAGVATSLRVVTAAGDIAMTAADGIVVINKAAGAATAVILEANPAVGATHTIKDGRGDASTNTITISPASGSPASGTIDGGASYTLTDNYGSATVVYTGVEWSVI